MSCPVVRFGLWPRWLLPDPAGAARRFARAAIAVVSPELPYSVLPFALRQAFGMAIDLTAPPNWQSRPVPAWRGVPCRIGTAVLQLHNVLPTPRELEFTFQALLPDRDPPGPPAQRVLLGSEFLRRFGLRVTLKYLAIRYLIDPATGLRQLDTRTPCGSLSIR
jgi:hypothetical protein